MADTKHTTKDENLDEDDEIDDDEDDDGEGGTKTTEKNDEDEGDDDDDSDEDEGDDIPPVRRSVAQHIITRQKNTIQKLRSKKDEDDEGADDDNDDIDDGADDRKASKTIGKEVQKHMAPVINALAKTADDEELKELFASEPEAKKYAKKIRAYMDNEHYQGVAPAVIYHHLAFGKASKTTQERKRAADIEANSTRGAGSGRRGGGRPAGNLPTRDEMEDMSDEDFEKLEHKARVGKFVKNEE